MPRYNYIKKLKEAILTNYSLYRKDTSIMLPRLIYIEPTNNCVMKCYMCPSRVGHRDKGFMTYDLFKKIIDDMHEYNQEHPSHVPLEQMTYLQGQGEPLMSNDIFKMITYVKSKNFKTGFTTTGALLTKEKAHNLIKTGIDSLELSCYSLTRDLYSKIHGSDLFETSFHNMIRLLHLTRGANITLNANILESVRTHKELDFLKYFYRSLPFDTNSYLKIENFHDILNELDLPEEVKYNSMREVDQVEATSRLLQLLYRWKTNNPKVRLGDCLWLSTLVNWNGNVTPCNADYPTRYIAGNVKNDNIFDIWNNYKYRLFRSAVLKNDYTALNNEKFCNYCTHASLVRFPLFSNYAHYLGNLSDVIQKISHPRSGSRLTKESSDKYAFLEKHFPIDEEDYWLKYLDNLKKEFNTKRS